MALLTVFWKVCDAMAFAHAKWILRRDLKAENIMVGEYGEVPLMGCGLAKVLGERDAAGAVKTAAADTIDCGMTMEGEVMGERQKRRAQPARDCDADGQGDRRAARADDGECARSASGGDSQGNGMDPRRLGCD